MTKHLIDLDEEGLSAAQAARGTGTIEETVNTARRRASASRQTEVAAALDVLASAELADRSDAWR